MRPEPLTASPPRPVHPALLRQDWRDVTFLHWALDPAPAAALLPAGTRPDVLDGRTFVGIVALRMQRTALLGGPALPWVGSFGQVNVRLYAVDGAGRRGVVFLSLDAERLPPAVGARWTAGLPYSWARVEFDRHGDRRTYGLRRRWPVPPPGHARIAVRVGAPRIPGPEELFLTARWGFHHRLAGRTVYGQVEHAPWRLRTAELLDLDTDLLAVLGPGAPTGPPVSVLFSPGMDDVRIGLPAT
ncbi:DUF2071 domain-containing protein [Blastococcus sp. CT_GayMR20]|uniref:YqjF family protein n=1 Tax=Blastococcus sp. CT_GayMR20 TaxID=2559609 RepID=UPI001ADDBB42|nr:DUF2071 domain-containing protein [Blastococcus sp. CT_GayMR20]